MLIQREKEYQEGKKDDALSQLFTILNRDSMVMAQSSPMGELMYISFASAFRTEAEAQAAESAVSQLGYNVTRNDHSLSVDGNFSSSEVQELAKSFTIFDNLLKKASKDPAAEM